MAIKEIVATEIEPVHLKMSYEEFLAWADEDIQAEWVEGEVIIFMPTKKVHQVTLQFLFELLELFVNLFDLGKVQVAPFEMKLTPTGPSREPDILFVSKENLERLTEDKLNGPADLVIEIISKDSVSRDRDDKFREYAAAGVREYWIIDPRPEKQRADFYHLDETGAYRLFGVEDDERVESRLLVGFWLNPAWLWEADSRDPFVTFCQMAGLPENTVNQFRQQLQAGFSKKPIMLN
jgi:Uma2 family endonuclease